MAHSFRDFDVFMKGPVVIEHDMTGRFMNVRADGIVEIATLERDGSVTINGRNYQFKHGAWSFVYSLDDEPPRDTLLGDDDDD